MTYYDSEIQAQDDLDTRERDLEALRVLEQWVADLRSGDFPQGYGQLQSLEGEFCCVGVLSERFHRQGNLARSIREYRDDDSGEIEQEIWYDGAWATVPTVLYNFFDQRGITLEWGDLYGMNDVDGKTFREIADYIEDTIISTLRAKLGR